MTDILSDLKELLNKLDQDIEPTWEAGISKAINSLRDPKETSELPMEFIAEAIAFDFHEDYQNQTTGWGTYYGPLFVFANDDGTAIESPSIRKVTEQIIKYWIERAKTAKHPILRSRYADLVWDFSKTVTNKPAHYTMAHIVIDSVIEIAEKNCHKYETATITKLKRALSLAVATNDNSRIERVRDNIISYEDSIAEDSKLGLWGFSYDLLYGNDKVRLTTNQEEKLIRDLEGHLQRASQPTKPENIDQWAAEAAALRLAKYYRKNGRVEDVTRVMVTLKDAFLQASSIASALQASASLQKLHATLREFGLADEAEEISIKLREVGEKAESELKSVSHTIEVPKEEIDKYIAALTEGKFDDVLTRITAHYIPKKSEVERQLKELAKKAPLVFHIPTEIQDDQGRPIAKVGSLEEDLSGHTVKLMAQNMFIESIFLRKVLESLIKRFPNFKSLYVDYLFRSPIFEENRKQIIELGVAEYINGNHLTATHILIPQIENAIRVLLEKAGGSVLKPARGGGFNLKMLDDLLSDSLIVQVFGEDLVFYFRTLLTDQRGWNVRNCVCHGLYSADEFGPSMSDRIIHVLLCLAQVREKGKE